MTNSKTATATKQTQQRIGGAAPLQTYEAPKSESVDLHPLVEAAMAVTMSDPDTARKMLDLQRDYQADKARRAFNRDMIALKASLPAVLARDKAVAYESERTGQKTEYTHASLSSVVEAVTPHLINYGFSLSWEPATPDKTTVSVTAKLTHGDGHRETATISAPPDNSGRKSAPQAIASTITLLERYTALALLGIATADMEEPQNLDRVSVAIQAIQARGRKLEDAILLVGGKQPEQWEDADFDALRAWLRSGGLDAVVAARAGASQASTTATPAETVPPEPARAAKGQQGRPSKGSKSYDPDAGEVAPEDEPPAREPGED